MTDMNTSCTVTSEPTLTGMDCQWTPPSILTWLSRASRCLFCGTFGV